MLMMQQPLKESGGPLRPLVLCVDDETHVLGALSRELSSSGVSVILTKDPEEAADIIERRDVDMIIADHRMPGLAGTALLRTVQSRSPATVRVMLTAYPDRVVLAERASGTVQCLLTKPWDSRSLRSLVECLGREQDDLELNPT